MTGRTLLLAINLINLEKIDHDMLECLDITDRDKLPFKLPPEIVWPIGEKKRAQRALVLLRAGWRFFNKEIESEKKSDKLRF